MDGPPSWVDPKTLSRQVWDAQTARSLPGVARALGIYGMAAACALQHQRSIPGEPGSSREELGLSRFLQRPDPDMALPTFIGVHLDDFLLHGNACHLVTALGSDDRPAAVRWFPAHRWNVQDNGDGQPTYLLDGVEVARDRVVHVRRGADPTFEWRGVGVVEQHLATLNEAGLQRAASSENLSNRGMPAVAVIQPDGSEYDPDNADKVAEKWEERFSTQKAKPGIFPGGTRVVPLSWSPSDQQLVMARNLTTRETASAFNLDAWWLGDPGGSHQYKSPAPMFLTLLRTSLNPVLKTFEDEWSFRWLPYGRGVVFDRLELLRDDLESMVETFSGSSSKPLFPDPNEPRRYMGFPELPDSAWPAPPPQLDPANQDPPPADPPAEDPPADPAPPEEDNAA
jgi:HK97 family phage portal protein